MRSFVLVREKVGASILTAIVDAPRHFAVFGKNVGQCTTDAGAFRLLCVRILGLRDQMIIVRRVVGFGGSGDIRNLAHRQFHAFIHCRGFGAGAGDGIRFGIGLGPACRGDQQ